ncbi:hypothetical protein SAMN05444156_0465 [Verrucomicrobium sp. GAS474]|uniref:hypothetical protein n=1 Tax=Verrucomicrobium sp. GAS474 TaxID=1882831 RepID=UPI00087A9491|nr:hypothetical protein [Verrucomicrobium sp. GAS474]SDT88998.1 hypothetical protein SAMN05444156_0465 [Verrucomicrobium sp. GAS474]
MNLSFRVGWRGVLCGAVAAMLLASLLPSLRADDEEGGGNPSVTPEQLNAAAGIALFPTGPTTGAGDAAAATAMPLWDEASEMTAKRLRIPRESITTTQSSYRLYPSAAFRLFGVRPYSIALYAKEGKPGELSIIFANTGDYFTDEENVGPKGGPAPEMKKLVDGFHERLRSDETTLRANITAVLGKPSFSRYGDRDMDYEVLRWVWGSHVLLLAKPQDKYVLLRIVPTKKEAKEVPKWEDRKAQLAQRVIRRENGDVILGEIPMVDQGPKGYCVPATWERYLRYLDIPADMYVLAQFGGTSLGGGTNPAALAGAAQSLASSNGLRIDAETRPFIFAMIPDMIDRGIPLMWCCRVSEKNDAEIDKFTSERKKTAWADWLKLLQNRTRLNAPIPGNGHMRMIVGYNKESQEIAISDSWGLWFEERWLPFDQAQQISENILYTIRW